MELSNKQIKRIASVVKTSQANFSEMPDHWDEDMQQAFGVFISDVYGEPSEDEDPQELFDAFEDSYQGEFDSMEDFAHDLIDDIGFESLGDNLAFYFDSEEFIRDLQAEGWVVADDEDAEKYPDEFPDGPGIYDPSGEFYSDGDSISEMVDELEDAGGVISDETRKNYFNYAAFGRDLQFGGDYTFTNGYVFNLNY